MAADKKRLRDGAMVSRPMTGVLRDAELRNVSQRFGVAEAQIRRDHVISHVLAAIADEVSADVVFFGGTALCRTHLLELRLSEDIDLIATSDRADVARRIQRSVARRLRRSLGVPAFSPDLISTRHPEPSVLSVNDMRVQLQLLSGTGYPPWPTEYWDIDQRYSDAPAARLRVLTQPAFAAAKLSAWNDRGTPRDLYDLWAMAVQGMIDQEAADLFSRFGTLTNPSLVPFSVIPSNAEWAAALEHQGAKDVSAAEAAEVVREAWCSRGKG